MKKRLLMAAMLLILCLGCLFTVASATEDTTPALSIDYTNLSYSESVYIKYAVSAKNVVEDDVRLLVWREPDANGYAYGTQDEIILPAYKDTIEGEEYIIFDYKNIAAKEMGDDIYVRPMVQAGGTVYTGDAVKYSVLRYAYDTIHDDTAAASLQELMRDMLAYGASAQAHFNYKTDTPVYNKAAGTIDWYDITLVNGTLADGFTSGLVYQNTKISDGLAYTENKDENDNTVSYTVSGIGTCTDTDIIIPATHNSLPVTSIGANAFRFNTNITSIAVSDGVTSIGSMAFFRCSSLATVKISSSVTDIALDAFDDCTVMQRFDVDEGNAVYSSIDGALYNKTGTTLIRVPCNLAANTFTIPSTVTRIETQAFYLCSAIINISVHSGVTEIGPFAFLAPSLNSIVVHKDNAIYSSNNGILYSKDGTNLIYAPCNSISGTFAVPSGVTAINTYAFNSCTGMTGISFPVDTITIGDYAFMSCTGLRSITFGTNIASIGNYAFAWCDGLTTITFQNNMKSIGESAFQFCTNLKTITFNDGVTSIGASAFYQCTNLTEINLPNSLTSIGEGAFSGCEALTEITIPNSITIIGSWFNGCSSLTTVNLHNNVTSIGERAFQRCSALTSITIPSGVISIGDFAFCQCYALADITIPDSVTSIGDHAFYDCTSLTTVYYTGTPEEWGQISIGSSNSYLTDAARYYYSETEPTDTTYPYWHYVNGVPTKW